MAGSRRANRGPPAMSTGARAVPPNPLMPQRSTPCRRTPHYRAAQVSCIHRSALEREQTLRTLLDEDDDEHQHQDLGEHRPRPCLEELVEDTEAHRRVNGSPELTQPAEHADHE